MLYFDLVLIIPANTLPQIKLVDEFLLSIFIGMVPFSQNSTVIDRTPSVLGPNS
jgi:hypothetical protein